MQMIDNCNDQDLSGHYILLTNEAHTVVPGNMLASRCNAFRKEKKEPRKPDLLSVDLPLQRIYRESLPKQHIKCSTTLSHMHSTKI